MSKYILHASSLYCGWSLYQYQLWTSTLSGIQCLPPAYYIKNVLFHWTLEPQIDVKLWLISWHNINRYDFDILLMSNCKYHMGINMISRMCLENDQWQNNLVKKKFGLKKMLVDVNVQHGFDANSWCQFDIDSCHHKNFHFLPMVDGQLTLTVGIILMSVHHFLTQCGCRWENEWKMLS